MRAVVFFGLALTPLACSLLVDTNGLSGSALAPDATGPDAPATTDGRSDESALDGTDARDADMADGDAAADADADADATTSADVTTTVDASASDAGPDGAASAAYRAAVLADGPSAYFRLDDASGCADEKGGTPCALAASGITRGVPGIAGSSAIRLEQVAATLTTALADTDLGKSFTIEAWIAMDAASAVPAKNVADMEDYAPSRAGVTMFLFTASQFRTETWSSGQFLSYTLAAAALTPTVFHHIVVGYDATTKLDFGYFDGALSEGGSQTDAAARPIVTHPLVFTGWTGAIDEVALYAKALPPARVLAHYGLR
ncbi:MAG: LamG-like jellyroll fold domain-containing protein [Polyangiaceae bacterium]